MTDGAFLIDKPAGPTSHDVVDRVRRAFGKGTKVGHAGTLDPFATGLLIVLVGRATRAQRFLLGLPKSYETVARLGWTSSTGDPEGELIQTGRIPSDPPELPTGRFLQRAPAHSAVKIDGKRAYEYARAGQDVETPERPVEVTRFEQLHREGETATFAIDCSSGTYVRTLVSDLGDAYCLRLRRTSIGPFAVGAADPEKVLGLRDLLEPIMETREIDGDDAAAIAHGRTIAGEAQGPILMIDAEGAVAIAQQREGGRLGAIVGFRG